MSDNIGDLKGTFPELFESIPLPDLEWDDFDIIESDPSGRIFDDIDFGDLFNPNTQWDNDNWLNTENQASDAPCGSTSSRPGHAGGFTRRDPLTSMFPPPDALAFYMPYHFYYPSWWGIYILYEGLESLAKYIFHNASPRPTAQDAVKAAHTFLYYHEAFHHRVECFATRFELVDRRPHYRKGFQTLYNATRGTVSCLEEALANATAAQEVKKKLRNSAIDGAIENYMAGQPLGYDQAYLYLEYQAFIEGRSKFAELNRATCFGGLPQSNVNFWGSVGHLFNGNTNVNSRINYLVPKGSPIAARLPKAKLAISPRKIERKLRKLAGLKNLRSGGRP
jgi:hypothetical protein